MSTTLPVPNYTATAYQRVIAEPLGGSREVFYYMNNFPSDIYIKAPDTHLYAFMRTILGNNGVNLMAKSFYQAQAMTSEMSLDVTDLDNFFANPFGFSRNASETYSAPTGPITAQVEQQIRSADSSYFARAVNYINGARAGNTPLGMQKVSEAGLGYGVEIIENYQYLFDQHSDLPLGLPYYGQTLSPNEFIVLPQAEISNTQVMVLSLEGTVTGGYINFGFGRSNQPSIVTNSNPDWVTRSKTYPVPAFATRDMVREAIEPLPGVGVGNVNVSGNPGGPWYINFQGPIDVNSIELLNIYNNLLGSNVTLFVDTLYGLLEANEEIINVTSEDAYTLFSALGNIQPVNSFVTLYPNSGIYAQVLWNDVYGTSAYNEVVRFVTGNPAITWPTESPYWIMASEEIQAPRIFKDIYYNYTGWHNINTITASTTGTQAIQTANQNPYNPQVLQTFPALQAAANYAEPLFVTSSEIDPTDDIDSYINFIYPIAYENIPGAPPLNYIQQYWQSQPGTGQDWLIIELGTPQAVNYITMDIVQAPVQVDIFYDTYDDTTTMNFVQVTPIIPYSNVLTSTSANNNLASMALTFSNSLQQMIFSRRYQIIFTRLNGYASTIQISNLRLGRNVAS